MDGEHDDAKHLKKRGLDRFLEEQKKNAPLFEGYTIEELSEKIDECDNICPTCGRPWKYLQPKRSNIYRLKKKQ